MIIFVLLFITFKCVTDALLIMGISPFSLIGGVWRYSDALSESALDKNRQCDPQGGNKMLLRAIHEGALLRVRPKVMIVATIMAGLLSIMWGNGSG